MTFTNGWNAGGDGTQKTTYKQIPTSPTFPYNVTLADRNVTFRGDTFGYQNIQLPSCMTVGIGFKFSLSNTSNNSVTVYVNGVDIFGNGYTQHSVGAGQICTYTVAVASRIGKWEVTQSGLTGSGSNSVSIGSGASSTSAFDTTVGVFSTCSNGSAAFGYGATATGTNSSAIGYGVLASAANSSAIGRNSSAQSATAQTGSGAMALGGSYASGTDSFAAANADNTGTYGAQGSNSVAIGKQAKATNTGSIAIGEFSYSSGIDSVAFSTGSNGGTYGALGQNSFAVGNLTKASGTGSIALGNSSYATGYGSLAMIGGVASGINSIAIGVGNSAQIGKFSYTSYTYFAVAGDSQQGILILRTQTTDATPTTLTSDGPGTSASTTNQVILTDNQAMTFNALITARQNTTGDTASWNISGCIKRGSGVATTALVGTNVSLASSADTGAALWTVAATADTTNGGLKITVTGQAAKTIRWSATVYTNELAG